MSRRFTGPPGCGSKYKAKRSKIDGHSFASRREASRYIQLRAKEKAGKIQFLTLQPRYKLICNGVEICTYVADFRYVENGAVVVEDVKGFRTPEYKIKVALLLALRGIKVVEID